MKSFMQQSSMGAGATPLMSHVRTVNEDTERKQTLIDKDDAKFNKEGDTKKTMFVKTELDTDKIPKIESMALGENIEMKGKKENGGDLKGEREGKNVFHENDAKVVVDEDDGDGHDKKARLNFEKVAQIKNDEL